MNGKPHRFSRHGGGRSQPPPQQQPPPQPLFNPNYLPNNYYGQSPVVYPNLSYENPNYYAQNLNSLIENINFLAQNHNFTHHNQLSHNRGLPHSGTIENSNIHTQNLNLPVENPNFQAQNPSSTSSHSQVSNNKEISHSGANESSNIHTQNVNSSIGIPNFNTQKPSFTPHSQLSNNKGISYKEILGKIENAVIKSRRELIAAGENVSALKVSQAALVVLQADSWESLGVQMQHVPSLYRLMLIEGKINAFIHCFVEVWKITTLYDLKSAICKNEGVQQFEELELGPLIRHPLVNHYFGVSSDSTKVYKITSKDILTLLIEFMDTHKGKEVKIDELMDFIAKKRCVDSKEKLHVRIQSLGMHIALIKQAKPFESGTIENCIVALDNAKQNSKKKKKRPLFESQKKQLDEKFSVISQRIKSFSSANGKHIRFISSSSEEDDDDNESDDNEDETCLTSQSKKSSQSTKSSDRVSSCPYPSATEEKTRLGIYSEKEESPALDKLNCKESVKKMTKKRKSDAADCSSLPPRKVAKLDDCGKNSSGNKGSNSFNYIRSGKMSLTDDSMMTFITLWKERCKTKNVSEVITQMIDFYQTSHKSKLSVKVIRNFFQTFPLVGLATIAVNSMKRGMWDSIYDTLQTMEQEEETETASKSDEDNVSIETEEADNRVASKQVSKRHCEVRLDDILKKVSEYYKDNHVIVADSTSPLEKNVIFFRSLYNCEAWLTQQFFVENFELIGFGDFFTFIERNVSALPPLMQSYFLNSEKHGNKPSLEACMSQQLLNVLIAQASHSLLENESLSIQKVMEFLSRQFPLIPFKLDKEGSQKALEEALKANKGDNVLKGVLFSSSLLTPRNVDSFSETHLSSKDAIQVLLRAPMLTDLNTWSHWDLLFAPSLGPLTLWLLNDPTAKELLCLVTKSGNVVRIDHTATVDSFLEAFIQGSPFQTSVNLLSLFALYGGERNIPSSLLKCHAEKAFKVLTKNSMNNGLKKDHQNRQTEDSSIASSFFLECLSYLPIEFRCFAADLLLSGLRSIIKDAPSAVMRQCRNTEHRLMLHEVGFSLGIMEWIDDHRIFSSSESTTSFENHQEIDVSTSVSPAKGRKILSNKVDVQKEEPEVVETIAKRLTRSRKHSAKSNNEKESAKIIESIRREEFGLDSNISAKEDDILKKQHARLGRALHCLSQELYSQDSHFLLELVQNADDNVYPCDVEPTLTFILQEGGVVVLNNEKGFSVENIKALCDVGNSTKKGPNAGYIGKKGIGFKSVFRVTDAPEIHSNGFHIKFDISDGQIGFVLPTIVPPCDVNLFSKLISSNSEHWNTCIILPFRSKKTEPFSVDNLISMFSDLHPSLLLFLHRLECIKFRNLLEDSLTVMRKEIIGNGIVKVSLGKEKMTWFVKSNKLKADHIRQDVKTTEISMALMLEDSEDGNYIAKLDHQPVFAFLPLRNYGLKFIIQADFILPSSREEVDEDSPWNQWLLSEFPSLFVNAETSFCNLPCFKKNPAKGVSVFLSFVPLGGEVHGFFSCLPRMIISKLRVSNCLLLEGENNEWVPPCKVLRNWTEETRSLLPDSLIKEHLGVGYLNKDTVLTDPLSRALGVEEFGPKILLQVMQSLCHNNSLKSMGLKWVSSWLNVLYSVSAKFELKTQSEFVSSLGQLPFIPLLDGKYTSIQEGAIWLHTDALNHRVDSDLDHGLEAFKKLYPKLRIVTPTLFNDSHVENITQMLYKVGVQRLSAHEVLKVHILPAISDEKGIIESAELMTEYLCFIMFHLESTCPECLVERGNILSQIRNNAFISTNHGYKRLVDVPIHFSKEFGNPIDMKKLVSGSDMKWFEIDVSYLEHPVYKSSLEGKSKWRRFLQELGVTDFVHIVEVEKHIKDIPHAILKNMMLDDECITSGSIVKNYDSQELMYLLSHISSNGDKEKCKYLLEVLDTLWDDYFSDKVTGFCSVNGQNRPFKSSIIRCFQSNRWLASSMDDQLHFSNELFDKCETVLSVLGDNAPYAIPKVKNVKLLNEILLKNTVTLDDALSVLKVWRTSEKPFKASVSQMSKFYTFIWNEMSISRQKIVESLNSQAFIFVPYSFVSMNEVVPGLFLSPNEVYWHDSTGSMEKTKSTKPQFDRDLTHHPSSKMLCKVYPGLRYFFVNEFEVAENPPLFTYLQSLQQVSYGNLPSQAAKTVFQVFKKWSDGLDSGSLTCDNIDQLKKSMEEKKMRILPTEKNKWVSLHQSFGLICWCDDDHLKKEFNNFNNLDFLRLGELTSEENQFLHEKVSVLFQRLGIPSLSEIVTREAIYYGPTDSSFKTSLVNWALPYAQRYIYTIHPNEYSEFKQSTVKNLNRLRIVVVEKLFYKNVIKRFNIESNKRCECTSLLQDTTLYTTRESDSHSLFMSLSRLLLSKIPELPLANFLHMITTMAESGSTEEQMEFFITNSQKLLKLPSEESQWCLVTSTSAPEEDNNKNTPTTSSSFSSDPPKSKTFRSSNSSWPPANWKSAPGFAQASKTQAFNPNSGQKRVVDWNVEEIPAASTIPLITVEGDFAVKNQTESSIARSGRAYSGPPNLTWSNTVTPQQILTGRTGEYVAFQYFSSELEDKIVKWVNEVNESGLPYDIEVEGKNNSKEYIEVKATSSATKDWFVISVREWQFAVEKGDSFSIARVVLADGKSAQITTYKNPLKLCQSGHLQLAVMPSKQ